MASVIEVTQDVVYELSGEKVIIPAGSIVQSPSELVGAPRYYGMVRPMRPCSPGLPRQDLSYGMSRLITVLQLQASTQSS